MTIGENSVIRNGKEWEKKTAINQRPRKEKRRKEKRIRKVESHNPVAQKLYELSVSTVPFADGETLAQHDEGVRVWYTPPPSPG